MDRYILTAQDQPEYSSTFYDGRFDDMWWEVSRYVVGPMPVDDFLQRFLRSLTPNPTPFLPITFSNLESLFEETSGEPGPYTKFVSRTPSFDSVNAVQPICSNFELRDVHSNPMHAFESLEIQPDLCVFNRNISDTDLCDPSKTEIMLKLSTDSEDPFDDNGKYEIGRNGSRAGRYTLGQITAYAAAQHAAQFRTHIFSILLFPKYARLFRWDRAGVVVTERFPLCSQYLMEFCHLYNHATPHVRGLDVSVSIPSETDASKACVALGGESPLSLVQLSLGSSSYIISRKDSWRLDSQTPEHDVYDRLRSSNVPNIPTVIEGGNILDHETFTQDLLQEELVWMRNPPRRLKKHRHYRLILKEIATPLHLFPSTKILVRAIHDAIKAHRAAYFDAGILHRDISSGNIMIYNNGGLLIDWDMSKNTQDKGARQTERTGTWPFISCRLLKDPTASQGLTDDVESFIHVITWVSFRYAKHNLPDEAVLVFLTSVFDYAWSGKDGLTKGGDTKMNYLNFPSQLMKTEFENPLLKMLLTKITKTISFRYRAEPSLEDADDDEVTLDRLLNAYKKRLGTLNNSEWIINELASVLKSPNWPANDEAKNTQIAQSTTRTGGRFPPSSLKRKNSEDVEGKNKKSRALTSRSIKQ
ncbi:hypothetical protein Clacol_003390 [Clathrus columnatus]|uniref:Fungal-type protein kinase domain-containing protein n=1 Tax=Clathrus columnatus TaxID=1419009 RepID=A0AAV5A6R3_9AGAM|nr:hypothetical protein Clacol_003390 [Clathrus columnatus]